MPRIPDAALGGPADQPWKRYVDGGLESLELALNRLASDSSASGKGLAATADGLARQISVLAQQTADLVGRASYQKSSTDTISWSSSVTGSSPFGPELTVTLNESRVISVSFFTSADASASVVGGGTMYLWGSTGVAIDGVAVSEDLGARGYILVSAASNAGASANNRFIIPITARFLVVLPAGAHTLRGLVYGRTSTYSGTGSGFGSIDLREPALFADVLQLA